MKNSELIDWKFSLNRLGGDRELLGEIIEIFLEDAPKLIQDLAASLAATDALTATRNAHNLKGLVSNFGDSDAVQSMRKTELAAGMSDLDSANKHFADFCAQYEQLQSELMAFTS